jgi:hypothetical protein
MDNYAMTATAKKDFDKSNDVTGEVFVTFTSLK